MRAPSRRLDQQGQSTVEFILTLSLLMGLLLFFVQTSLVMGWGSYVQYATFMSARAYLSGGSDPADQLQRAEGVAQQMLRGGGTRDRFASLSRGFDGDVSDFPGLSIGRHPEFRPGNADFSWLEGVRYKFKSSLFMVPFAGSRGAKDPATQLELESESWLGREPTVSECNQYMRQEQVKGIIDNGC